MKVGMIGLGKMGGNMAERLRRHGHEVVGMDPNTPQADARSIEELVPLLAADGQPRVAWSMVPAGHITDSVISELARRLEPGDVVVDGGNSNYLHSIRHGEELAERGIGFVDCGTSGGVWGLDNGYALMVGGTPESVAVVQPLFDALAPERGFAHVGPVGAGHYVKMVHNGVEYGMMAAIAEGLSIIRHADAGLHQQEVDAETTPLRDPRYYQYEIDVGEVAEVWRRGSVVGSWLVDLTAAALAESPDLAGFEGRVSDSGEGRWTVMAAIEEGVPASVIASALNERFESRDLGTFTGKLLSAMRGQFGGHAEKPAPEG